MNRRELLRGVVAAGAAGTLAGCVADSPGDTNSTTDGDDGPGPSLVGENLTETGADCAESDARDTATVMFGDDTVTVTGGVGTSNPCYEVSLTGATYDADADVVTVTVAATPEDAVCQQCLGVVRYEAAVEFDGGLPGTVTVQHERDGETTTVTTAER